MRRLLKALLYSRDGLFHAARHEKAVQQELFLLLIALPASLFATYDWWKRLALVGVVLLVVIIELINSALEEICDHVQPETHPSIKIAKDLASAAVFICLLLAGMTWLVALIERFT